ncbi:MAG TPA: glycosyltransferase family 1 protein [Chloroflexi bacterium]|nr:glycosyltransferase family 1 protein [Chloroflexota bacterium]
MWRWITRPVPNLWRLEPLLPLRQVPALKGLTWPLMAAVVGRWLARQRWGDVILWIYLPEAARVIDLIPHRLLVYHCVDDWRTFPQFATRRAEIAALEDGLTRRADLVITTAPALYEARRSLNAHTILQPNVGDYAHFTRADDLVPPPDLAGLPQPRLGFWGALDDYKFDRELVLALADACPNASIVLIGPAGVAIREQPALALNRPNIHCLGQRPYEQLPAYAAGLDVCLIPYRQTEHTRGVFPIKFFEMLATGKPVVATALPSLAPFGDTVPLTRTTGEFVAAVQAVLADPAAGRTQRLALAAQHTWEQRVDELLTYVAAALQTHPAREPLRRARDCLTGKAHPGDE